LQKELKKPDAEKSSFAKEIIILKEQHRITLSNLEYKLEKSNRLLESEIEHYQEEIDTLKKEHKITLDNLEQKLEKGKKDV